jgi:hypothetical protein
LGYRNEQKEKIYNLALSFQDASGNDLVKGIGLSDRCCPVDVPEEQAQSGSVKPDLYALDIIVPAPCRSAIAPSRFEAPGITMYKYNGSYILKFGYAHFESECPDIEMITFKLKCPYVFGDDAVHEFVTYWENTNEQNGNGEYAKCNRIEFEGREIASIIHEKKGPAGGYTSVAAIILEDSKNQ